MGMFWKINATEMPSAAPPSSTLQFVGFSLHLHNCCLCGPQKEHGWGSRGRGAASFAAEALPVLLISGMRSQRCPPQWEAANKLIRIMGN